MPGCYVKLAAYGHPVLRSGAEGLEPVGISATSALVISRLAAP